MKIIQKRSISLVIIVIYLFVTHFDKESKSEPGPSDAPYSEIQELLERSSIRVENRVSDELDSPQTKSWEKKTKAINDSIVN